MKRYRSILYVPVATLAHLGAESGGAELWDARIPRHRTEVVLVWAGGITTVLPWAKLKSATGLPHLPSPSRAFCIEPERDTVGLLLESTGPTPGLRYQEPHSLVATLGWLTPDGLTQTG